jgi:hypothetical protein
MPLQLSHVGEDLIAEMLASLSERGELANLACAFTGRTLADDVRECKIAQPLMFCASAALPKVGASGQVYTCDGEQTVDVLCVGGKDALAIEAKLGETRMGTAEFKRRFCLPCEISRHSNSRLRGSMIAVLDRSLPFSGPYRIIAQIDDAQWTVAIAWWLIVRQPVLDRWGKRPDFLSSSARVLAFDTLARQYGSRQQFDQLVMRVVGSDFARGWRLPISDQP